MNFVKEVIEHYINQLISDVCIIELNKLANDYKAERANIDTPHRHIGDKTYKEITEKENPRSVRLELMNLDIKYKTEATKIATKHAEKEGVKLIEWQDKNPEKSTAEKSNESQQNLNTVQDRILRKTKLRKKITIELEERNKETVQEKSLAIKPEPDQTKYKKDATENSVEEKNGVTREELKALLRQQLAYEIKQRDSLDPNREK